MTGTLITAAGSHPQDPTKWCGLIVAEVDPGVPEIVWCCPHMHALPIDAQVCASDWDNECQNPYCAPIPHPPHAP